MTSPRETSGEAAKQGIQPAWGNGFLRRLNGPGQFGRASFVTSFKEISYGNEEKGEEGEETR
jgi:hypothetical protein